MSSLIRKIQKSILENATRVAITHNDQTYTYQDLETNSNKLAGYLSRHGVKKGSNVAFLLHRSFETLTTILAIWKQGATYIPLDPSTPKIRIENILNNLHPSCIVSEPALLSKISISKTPLVTLKDMDYIKSEAMHTLAVKDMQDVLAYVIYTSGSTGEPKGVMLTHANLTNHVLWLIQDFGFSSQDCFSFNSSMAFDFTVATTIIPLAVGAKIVVTSEEDTLEIETYCKQLEKNKVTFAKWTPSYFKLLVDYVEIHKPNLSSFRYIMLAGEELLRSYVERWLKIYPTHILVNEYGPTETAVGITTHIVTKDNLDKKLVTIPIGKPAINSTFYVVDSQNNLVEDGHIGELLIGGASVARGYYHQPMLTAERFIENPFSPNKDILYRTGDLVKKLPDGTYLYISRIDNQVKVNGYRIELNEIEHWILHYPGVEHTKVIIEKNKEEAIEIVAYLVIKKSATINFDRLKAYLSKHIPHYMYPTSYIPVTHIPCNRNGKVDINALKKSIIKSAKVDNNACLSPNIMVQLIVECIEKHLPTEKIELNTPFFSMGITSLLAAQIITDINLRIEGVKVKIQDLFTYPTLTALAAYIETQKKTNRVDKGKRQNKIQSDSKPCEPIAIIAMDCRLPGADNCDMLWETCRDGKEHISFFEPDKNEQLPPLDKKHEVYARGILKDIEYFDADFFNFTPKEAHLSDPQHRLLIESAWIALEKAGYIPNPEDLYKIGVYVSMNDSTYLLNHNLGELLQPLFNDRFAMQRLMSPQMLATKIAYHFNCTGPSITAQTACSSSLVSVVLACQQLASHQCNLALAGGVSLSTPQESPYLFQQGNIFSPDGHCKPFDANAEGTVFSNGLGIVVLKRLSDALKDNDNIISVLRGYSTNNDGNNKVSYTAPSVHGQMSCILAAQQAANIDVNSIQYIETHGTGTLIGDPIEIEALTKAFQISSNKKTFCALGSIKANIGHTHVAAGVAGLIKTALALQNKQIPPLINCNSPNPHIDWEHTPFYINTKLHYWEKKNSPRRAAVSAFGVGGTNAHVILEEAPESKSFPSTKQSHLLFLSAKTKEALKIMHDDLIHYLKTQIHHKNEKSFLADVAYTLLFGRKKFQYQSGVICDTITEAIISLQKNRNKNSTLIDLHSPINWFEYYRREKRRRIPLPTYPFQKKRFWFDEIISPTINQKESTSSPSFYAPTWMRTVETIEPISILTLNLKEQIWIIFDNNSELSQCSIDHLKSENSLVYIIRKGITYEELPANIFIINPSNKEHYNQAILKIAKKEVNKYAIIHFWSMDKYPDFSTKNDLDSPILLDGLYSGVFLIQAFQIINPTAILSTVMVTTQLHAVTGDETIEPLKATVLSLCRVLPLENKNHRFNSIDIDIDTFDNSNLLGYSTNMIQTAMLYLHKKNDVEPSIIAYRNRYCWKPIYQQIEVDVKTAKFSMNTTGVYFITGGLGAMGLTVAHWLSKQQPVKLLLLSKTPFPKQDEWDKYLYEADLDDGIRKKIQVLKQIISHGADITIATGDIANFNQMKLLIEHVETTQGTIKGIFHLAGIAGEGIALLKNKDTMRTVMSPKIQGAWVLSQLFKNTDLDFMVCASSLTAIAGGIGQLDYCAANLFLDYFISSNSFENCKQLVTINWNSWSSIGMAAQVKSSLTHEKLYLENSVTPEQGIEILATLLQSHHKRIIISHVAPEAERKRIINAFEKGIKNHSTPLRTQDHSLLDTQDLVQQIWKDILGVHVIQEKDTFYSLGGDSLLAIQLLDALEKQFKINLTLQDLAYLHTTKTLAKLIETRPLHTLDIILPLKLSQNDKNKSVYFIHPLGGSVLCYFPLASYLKTDLSYYAIQDPEIAKGNTLFHSIKDMAKYYAEEIHTRQKSEEIILIGSSYGGNIAIEMLPYLSSFNISVNKVILIDSWATINQAGMPHDDSIEIGCSESLKIIKDYYGIESEHYKLIKRRLLWLRSYTPSKTDTQVILLAAKELLPFYEKIACENNGWTAYSSKSILKYTIDGTHDTMLHSNNLPELATRLNNLLCF